MDQLNTQRLRFRQWKPADVESLVPFFKDESFTRFIGGPKNAEATWRLIAAYHGQYQWMGHAMMALETHEKELIGSVGLKTSDAWPELELGYWCLPNAQGKGYMSEAGEAARDYAFKELRSPSLVSYIDSKNTASIKLAEKLGAKYEKTIPLADFGLHGVWRYPHPGQ